MAQSKNSEAKPVVGALSVAGITALVFFYVFPWFIFTLAIIPTPIVSEIVVALVNIPIFLLDLEVPGKDPMGFKGTVAKWFWSPLLFAVIFFVSWKNRQRKAGNITNEEPPLGY